MCKRKPRVPSPSLIQEIVLYLDKFYTKPSLPTPRSIFGDTGDIRFSRKDAPEPMMTYKVQSTERTTGIAAEHETKAMLYLLNEHTDNSQMHWFVIDFFNDVTGVNKTCRKSWDVQSKSSKTIAAKALGEYSVTLFKNYCSCLSFKSYILFVGGVGKLVREKNYEDDVFCYKNMRKTAKDSFISGLVESAKKVEYIDNKDNIV